MLEGVTVLSSLLSCLIVQLLKPVVLLTLARGNSSFEFLITLLSMINYLFLIDLLSVINPYELMLSLPIIRMKCAEFLLLLIGHVDGRDMQPMASVHDDIRRLLGEKSASLIWAASQFGSTLDPEERMTALHIQARRVLESLDLFGV